MKVSTFRPIQKLTFGFALAAITAAATPIVYSTSTTPNPVFSTSMVTISYTGVSNGSVDPLPAGSNTSLGYFTVATTSLTDILIPSTNFVLNIVSSSPTVASGSLSGFISGVIRQNNSNLFVTFNNNGAPPPNTTVGNYLFALYNRNPEALVPPTTNNGRTTIQAQVFQLVPDVNTPEPASFALLGGGLLLVTLVRRRG